MTKVQTYSSYLLLISFFSGMQFYIRNLSTNTTLVIPLPTSYIGLSIDPQIVKSFLGIRLFVSQLIWMDTLIKSDIVKEKKSFTTFYQAAKVMTDLDPDNFLTYYVAGLYLSVIKDDISGATALLRAGAQRLEKIGTQNQDSWKIMFALGYHLLFEEQAFDEGSQWILKASTMPFCPAYVKALAAHLVTESERLEVGNRILADLYQRATKPEEKKRIKEKILKITQR